MTTLERESVFFPFIHPSFSKTFSCGCAGWFCMCQTHFKNKPIARGRIQTRLCERSQNIDAGKIYVGGMSRCNQMQWGVTSLPSPRQSVIQVLRGRCRWPTFPSLSCIYSAFISHPFYRQSFDWYIHHTHKQTHASHTLYILNSCLFLQGCQWRMWAEWKLI